MVDFGKNLQKNDPDQSSRPGCDLQVATDKDVATAEYSYFYIHQIKAWSSWAVDLAEISYTIDSPCYLNVGRSADV
jgi:hypothetical protein